MENQKPAHFFVFKIIGFIGIIVGIIGFCVSMVGFGKFDGSFMTGGILEGLGMVVGIPCLIFGFRPEISKMMTKSARYIQQQNKDDLKDIVDTTADIASEGITKTTHAIKKGLSANKIYCKHCGAQIDADSKFCNQCGEKQ